MDIPVDNLLALDATEHLLVALLEAALADIVAHLVVGVALQVGIVYLAHIAQHLCGDGPVVDSQCALRDIEALETEHLVLEPGIFLFRDLLHEDRTRVGGVVGGLLHAFLEVVDRDAQTLAEKGGVEVFHHAGDDHQVVDGFVMDEQIAVAVVDEATGRILCEAEQRLFVGIFAVLGIE